MRRDILNDARACGFISRRPYAEACHPLQRTLVGTAIFLSYVDFVLLAALSVFAGDASPAA